MKPVGEKPVVDAGTAISAMIGYRTGWQIEPERIFHHSILGNCLDAQVDELKTGRRLPDRHAVARSTQPCRQRTPIGLRHPKLDRISVSPPGYEDIEKTFKLVGVMLFAVEIGFFIIRPVWSELKEWRAMRSDIFASRRTYVTIAIVAGLIVLAAMPLSTRVSAPALILPETFVRLFPEEAGRVEEINAKRGDTVRKGDVLFVISSPTLVQERGLAEIEIDLAQQRIDRIGADAEDLAERGVIATQLSSLVAKRDGLEQREAKLVVRAPFNGRIADMNAEIAPGQWISRKEQLAFLSADDGSVIRGYVSGNDRSRIEPGSTGWFIPDDLTQPKLRVVLASVAISGAQQLEIPQLTSQFGGRIAVHASDGKRLVPIAAEYAVTARAVDEPGDPAQTWRGVLLLDGRPESLLARAWRQVLKVLVREAGA
ncbi:HlyD family efflux transporter periplasmic adaptor subunit [Mesorhizobium sp. CCNWLW179-1]|uniref:efflux RND transporter periplasmic adaptor subunit n=1 Tax=unclassified Mesorhizobium TaxID=325217 RepID=UPI0030150D04